MSHKQRKRERQAQRAAQPPLNKDDYERAVVYFGQVVEVLHAEGRDASSVQAAFYYTAARHAELHNVEHIFQAARRIGWPPHPRAN